MGAFAGLSSVPPQRGLDCLGTLATANLDIMQPCEMLHLRMMMLRRQAVTLVAVEQRELEFLQRPLVSQIARGLSSTARGLRVVVPLAPNTLHQLRLLQFHPFLLLRDTAEVPLQIGGLSAVALAKVGEHRSLRVGGQDPLVWLRSPLPQGASSFERACGVPGVQGGLGPSFGSGGHGF
ncbi:hypothetical protein E2C01_054283 [Portunus trituberculatus]|uniref:Uncharacterized protein n=1 Tax=Portunus trituberculatus TaxID=210409 RepID=A0A5B7GUK5_PORTR|nr:hypothetical protein [Portunus trituberculatus]